MLSVEERAKYEEEDAAEKDMYARDQKEYETKHILPKVMVSKGGTKLDQKWGSYVLFLTPDLSAGCLRTLDVPVFSQPRFLTAFSALL